MRAFDEMRRRVCARCVVSSIMVRVVSSWLSSWQGGLAGITLAPFALLAGTGSASAHVKWFCAYDVAGQPRGLEQVLCPDFEWLTGLALMCLMFGCLAEGTPLGGALLNALDRVTTRIRTDTLSLIHI